MHISEAEEFGVNPVILNQLIDSGLEVFTVVQKEAITAGLCNGVSLIISAPTSSGKTTIAEIAAIEGALKGKKTIYLVTHRALAEEKYDWQKIAEQMMYYIEDARKSKGAWKE